MTTAGLTAGIDLGGTKCLGVALDEAGNVVAEHRLATPVGTEAIVETIVAVATALGSPASVGVGAPGLVDVNGVLRFAPNLPGVVDVALRTAIEARLPGTSVRIENDASAAGWAESQVGAARGVGHALMVTLGTGIGGGVIAGCELLRGASGFAGEIGHMVVDAHGPPCSCGRRGCWERLASGSGLGRLAREAAVADPSSRIVELAGGDADNVRGEHVTRAAAEGDAHARAVMDRFGWWVALGLANLVAILDPQRIVLGGGLVSSGEVLLVPVREAFAEQVEGGEHRPEVPIVAATLGERAGAIGAALLAGQEKVAPERAARR
ncbi:MAG: ROK family protein [Actinomycetota bacterium]|nr:ROK family protein [Actinomycetota bacterium]